MILKHRDTEVLRFEWLEPEGVHIVSVNESARRFLPLDLHGEATDEGLSVAMAEPAKEKDRGVMPYYTALHCDVELAGVPSALTLMVARLT